MSPHHFTSGRLPQDFALQVPFAFRAAQSLQLPAFLGAQPSRAAGRIGFISSLDPLPERFMIHPDPVGDHLDAAAIRGAVQRHGVFPEPV